MKKLTLLLSTIIASFFVFTACIEKVDFEALKVPNYEGIWKAPLIKTKTTFKDIVEYSIAQAEDVPVEYIYDSLQDTYTIVYYDSITGEVPEDYYKLDDRTVDGEVTMEEANVPNEYKPFLDQGIPVPAVVVASVDSFAIDTNFYIAELDSLPIDGNNKNVSDAKIEYVTFREGQITIEFKSTFNHDVNVNAALKSVTDIVTGDTLNTPLVELGPNCPDCSIGAGNYSKTITIDLKNKRFDLYDLDNDEYNKFSADVSVVIYPIANQLISSSDKVEFEITFSDMTYDLVVGELGTFELLNYGGNVEFSLFDDGFGDFNVTIGDPRINLEIGNTSGVPFNGVIDTLDFYNNDNLTSSIDLVDNVIAVKAQEDITARGDTTRSYKNINNANTNNTLGNVINNEPNSFRYNVSVQVDGSNRRSWLAYDSKVYAKTTGEIPLYFSVQNYVYSDTMDTEDLGLPELDDIIKENEQTGENDTVIDWAELKIVAFNELPFDIDAQFYFVDSLGVPLDSLLNSPEESTRIWTSSEVDANGELVEGSTEVSTIALTKSEFVKLIQSKQVIYTATLNTAELNGEQIPVYLKGNYGFSLDLGARFKANYPINTTSTEE